MVSLRFRECSVQVITHQNVMNVQFAVLSTLQIRSRRIYHQASFFLTPWIIRVFSLAPFFWSISLKITPLRAQIADCLSKLNTALIWAKDKFFNFRCLYLSALVSVCLSSFSFFSFLLLFFWENSYWITLAIVYQGNDLSISPTSWLVTVRWICPAVTKSLSSVWKRLK